MTRALAKALGTVLGMAVGPGVAALFALVMSAIGPSMSGGGDVTGGLIAFAVAALFVVVGVLAGAPLGYLATQRLLGEESGRGVYVVGGTVLATSIGLLAVGFLTELSLDGRLVVLPPGMAVVAALLGDWIDRRG